MRTGFFGIGLMGFLGVLPAFSRDGGIDQTSMTNWASAGQTTLDCRVEHGPDPDEVVPVTPPSVDWSLFRVVFRPTRSLRREAGVRFFIPVDGYFVTSWRQGRNGDELISDTSIMSSSPAGTLQFQLVRLARAHSGPDIGSIFFNTWKYREEKFSLKVEPQDLHHARLEFERNTWTVSNTPGFNVAPHPDLSPSPLNYSADCRVVETRD